MCGPIGGSATTPPEGRTGAPGLWKLEGRISRCLAHALTTTLFHRPETPTALFHRPGIPAGRRWRRRQFASPGPAPASRQRPATREAASPGLALLAPAVAACSLPPARGKRGSPLPAASRNRRCRVLPWAHTKTLRRQACPGRREGGCRGFVLLFTRK